jgi:hypothetical protein
VLLGGAQQIIQERHIKLQDLDEFHDSAIGNVELTVKIKSLGSESEPYSAIFL